MSKTRKVLLSMAGRWQNAAQGGSEQSPTALYSKNEVRAALRGSQDTRGFASSGWPQERDCAVASPFAADRLQCGYIDVRPSKFREDIGNGTGAVVAVNEKRRTFAQPELGLLCGGERGQENGYPIESALLGVADRGWRSANSGTQTIRLIFDESQKLRRIWLVFEDSENTRTQEFVLRWVSDTGHSFREIVRQQWNLSPPGSVREIEDYSVELSAVTILELIEAQLRHRLPVFV